MDWYCDEVLSGQRAIDIVSETDTVLAFHHTRPAYGAAHIVVIPKRHIPSLLSDELTESLLLELVYVVREIAARVLNQRGACRVITNLGGYQETGHLHWHIVSGDRIVEPVDVAPSRTAMRYSGGFAADNANPS